VISATPVRVSPVQFLSNPEPRSDSIGTEKAPERGYEVLVQTSRSLGAIEQHGDAGGTETDVDDDTSLASQLRASGGSECTHLEAHADNNLVGFLNHHQIYSISDKEMPWPGNKYRRDLGLLRPPCGAHRA
jgi:hypothetical protein